MVICVLDCCRYQFIWAIYSNPHGMIIRIIFGTLRVLLSGQTMDWLAPSSQALLLDRSIMTWLICSAIGVLADGLIRSTWLIGTLTVYHTHTQADTNGQQIYIAIAFVLSRIMETVEMCKSIQTGRTIRFAVRKLVIIRFFCLLCVSCFITYVIVLTDGLWFLVRFAWFV